MALGTFKLKENGNLSIDLKQLLNDEDSHKTIEPGGLDWSEACLGKSIMDSQDEDDPED